MLVTVVPHEATQSSVTVWLGLSDVDAPPAGLQLEIEGRESVPIPPGNWRPITAGGKLSADESRTFTQSLTIDGLPAGTRVPLSLLGTRATSSTLPKALPRPGEPPLTVLLTSCFAATSPHARVGEAVRAITKEAPIDLKFLFGDQVYLDFPGFLVGGPFTDLPKRFFTRYVNNWMVEPDYKTLLSLGASWFTADDHEFWNNYPNFQFHLPATFTEGGRQELKAAETPLFQDFQCSAPERAGRNRRFDVGRLSFMVTDTRVNRQAGDDVFLDPGQFDDLLEWISGLSGPGVLVVGQPLFTTASNVFAKKFADRTLPNYKQYAPLASALADASHSILILTGDVHFARVSMASMPKVPATEITEIIASPLALISGRHSKPSTPPGLFPPEATGSPRGRTSMLSRADAAGDNLCTLQFTEVSGRVNVRIKHWFLQPDGIREEDPIERVLD